MMITRGPSAKTGTLLIRANISLSFARCGPEGTVLCSKNVWAGGSPQKIAACTSWRSRTTPHRRMTIMPDTAFANGVFLPLAEATVSVEDRGVQFADGVYELLRVYGGVPFRPLDHLPR